jgi:hypothetical protein
MECVSCWFIFTSNLERFDIPWFGHFYRQIISLNNCNRTWRPVGLCDVGAPTFSPDNRLTNGGKVVSLTCRPLFTPQGRLLVLVSVRDWVDPRAILRLEGLGQLKKKNDFIGTRTCDLPACSIVPQPSTTPRAPTHNQAAAYYPITDFK